MKIYRILFIFILSLSSCLSDKGNYDYVKVDELFLSFPQNIYKTTFGESIEIVPEVRYYDKKNLNKPNVNYEWIIDGVVVSTEPTYIHTGGSVPKKDVLWLTVEDKVVKHKFSYFCNVATESAYRSGYLILHEDENGDSDISIISSIGGIGKPDANGKSNDTLFYKKEYKDIYSLVNGQSMGKNPVSLTEHTALDGRIGSLLTEVTVITENGNRMEDLNGDSFKKETSVQDEFPDGMPDNYKTKKAIHACWDSYLVDDNGRMFTRRNALSNAYHTSVFNKNSTYNGDVKYDNVFMTYYKTNGGILALEFDEMGKRNFIGISCALYNGDVYNGIRMTVLPAKGKENLMSEVQDVKGEILFSDHTVEAFVDYSSNIGQYFVVKEDGKFFLRYYEFGVINRRANIELHAAEKVDLSQFTGGKDVLGMVSCKALSSSIAYNIVYFHDGSKIYAYSFDKKTCEVLFDGKGKIIAAFDAYTHITYFYRVSSVDSSIAVAFGDGSVEVYEMVRETLMSVHHDRLLFKTENNYGKIKQIVYKYGISGNLFDNN